MKNKKIRYLILLVALLIARSQLYVFSETNNNKNTNATFETKHVELDGQIGEWNPDDNDSPDFNNQEIEGSIPGEDEYYTISVTVPISM